ncbi:integral membrane protein [Seiridium cupressi]|uniref:FAR-17a/AIG1-like protein n=1 Tax=Seiridium unicorne TaxID=138068 RepID=A0ABR2UVJ6_9PEZI
MAGSHPLQRLRAPSRSLSLILHAAGITSFLFSFQFLNNWETPLSKSYGGNYQFLTIIGLAGSLLTFSVGLLSDLTLSPQLFRLKNHLATITAPLEILITILYWGLCAIDKSLVFPPEFQLDILPDVGFHAAPGVFLALDLLLFSPPWTIERNNALVLSLGIAFGYWYWVEYCFGKNGWYPYPIFDMLSTWQRVALFSVSALVMTGSTMVLKWVYGKANGIEKFKKEAATKPAGGRIKAA